MMTHSLPLDRRTLLAGGTALALLPRRLGAQPVAGFTHGVASGEPGPRSMLFWTRFVGTGSRPVPLTLEVATNPRMSRPHFKAELSADPARDWCAHAQLSGLAPGTTYYYRFTGPQKARSMLGRTRTLPEGNPAQFRIAVCSCSNLPFGWFNAYGHMVAADDIDLVVHLGDYIYEYPVGTYPTAQQAVAGRPIAPPGELLTVEDYRARYRSYRVDPDLQALHASFPMVVIWDDHEVANDAWKGGAENHTPETEGDWQVRLAAARQVWREWMPASGAPYASYEVGRLLTLHRLDTRIEGRDRQLNLGDALKLSGGGGDMTAAMLKFRDEQWLVANRQILGRQQEKWLADAFVAGARSGVRWQVLAQQVIMGTLKAPPESAGFARGVSDARIAARMRLAASAAAVGLPMNMDAWDGYPAARARLLASAQRAASNLVVLAGDSHNAWGFDLLNDGKPAGVEFATQSVSSPGFEAYVPGPPADLARALMAANPLLRWCDTSRRGYTHVTFTPAAAVAQWRFTAPVASRTDRIDGSATARVVAGSNRLQIG